MIRWLADVVDTMYDWWLAIAYAGYYQRLAVKQGLELCELRRIVNAHEYRLNALHARVTRLEEQTKIGTVSMRVVTPGYISGGGDA